MFILGKYIDKRKCWICNNALTKVFFSFHASEFVCRKCDFYIIYARDRLDYLHAVNELYSLWWMICRHNNFCITLSSDKKKKNIMIESYTLGDDSCNFEPIIKNINKIRKFNIKEFFIKRRRLLVFR